MAAIAYSPLLAVLCYIIYRHVLWPRLFSPLRHLPHPEWPRRGSLLFGHAPSLFKKTRAIVFRQWAKTIPNNGLIWYFSINRDVVIVTTNAGIREVLVEKYGDYCKSAQQARLLGPTVGNGLILADGDEHKRQRRLMGPSFRTQQLEQYSLLFWSCAAELVQVLRDQVSAEHAEKGEKATTAAIVEMGSWSQKVTLDVIGEAGMGRSFESVHDDNAPMAAAYNQIVRSREKLSPVTMMLRLLLPFNLLRILGIGGLGSIHAAVESIKEKAREIILQERKEIVDSDGTMLGSNILSGMLHDKTSEIIETEDLVEQALTLLTAGHKTVSSAFTWALYNLAKDSKMQTKLRKELSDSGLPLAEPGSESPASSDLENCAYLQAIIHETLRLYPSVPIFPRTAKKYTVLCGQPIPRGTTLILAPWIANVSMEAWGDDAESFNPDRWTAGTDLENKKQSNEFSTFGFGRTNCIGQRFARIELAYLLAAFVSRFQFELRDPELVLEPANGATANPGQPLYLKLSAV